MAVVLKTYGEQLAEVQEAISKVMSSQRYSYGGREVQYVDLEWLTKREQIVQNNLNIYGDVLPNRTARTGRAYGVSFG